MEPYQQLEAEWAAFNGLDPAGMVVCASGTAALHLALEALQLPPGSEVLVPDYTMIACARAVTLAGLTPVFVDCDERLLMDAEVAAPAQEQWTASAIMAVHVYGRRCNMNWKTTEWTHRKIKVIEDLAEAHGVKPHPETDAACWSFFKNKIVAGEEGGAVWFRNPEHAALARLLRCQGFTEAHDYRHVPRGHNYRMSNMHALAVLRSLRYVEEIVALRRKVEGLYDEECPDEWRMPPRDAPWVYDLRIRGLTYDRQDVIVAELRSAGIQARHGFKPMSEQPEFRNCRLIGGSNATVLASEVIYLPLTPGVVSKESCRVAFQILHRLVK